MGDARDDEGVDRHCFRKASSGRMKCFSCADYNFGVVRGCCDWCKFDRFDTTLLRSVFSNDLDDTLTSVFGRLVGDHVEFEARVEKQHRWSKATYRALTRNTQIIIKAVRDVFGQQSWIHKEGSLRKDTAVESSDVDLMITLEGNRAMTIAERDELVRAMRCCTYAFKEVAMGHNSIKITPFVGPMIDIIAHCSDFVAYSPERVRSIADNKLRGKPAMSLAVSGLKIWWHSVAPPEYTVPGSFWEVLVTQLQTEDLDGATTSGNYVHSFIQFSSGFTYFLQTMKLLADSGGTSSTSDTWTNDRGSMVAFKWTPILPEDRLAEVRRAAANALELWDSRHDLRAAFGI
jgi:hypothetical protein